MAEETGRRRRQRERKKPERKGAGWFVILRVDDLGGGDSGSPAASVSNDAPQDAVSIGERLSVVKVAQGHSSEVVAREHREAIKADWAKQRAAGGDDLPDVFPVERYRCVGLNSYIPGHYVEEERGATSGLF